MRKPPSNAIDDHRRAIALDPIDAPSHGRLGMALRDVDRIDEAVAILQRGAVLAPQHAMMRGGLAQALFIAGNLAASAEQAALAIALSPDLEAARRILIKATVAMGVTKAAVDGFRRGLVALPQQPDLLANFGVVADRSSALDLALSLFDRAWVLMPGLAAVLNNKGSTFRTAGRLGDASRALRQALLLEPGLAAAANGLATTFRDLADGAASQTMYRRALILAPEDAASWSNRLYGAHYLPEIDGPALLALHRAWANSNNLEPVERVLSKTSIQTERPLRIGFASPDFAQHPIGYFTLGLFEQADPAKLSIHCYSDRPVEDAVTRRLAKAVPNWRPVAGQSHAAWRQIVQDDALDVLVDLAGHTADGRLLEMAERLAPIQASWAGYVGTTGLPSMDLLIADAHHVQPGEEGWYDEDILRLPHGYVSYTPVANPETLDREPGPLTFACFNNPAKLNDGVLDLWARLLVSVPQARLLLRYRGLDDPAQSGRILERLNFGGVDRSRVLLEAGGGRLEMLQAYRRADVALDPYPYSGGLTTLEALWMGVPVVTLPGQGFAGRHSVSHLTVSGHADWIARDRGDYLGIARELAQKSRSGAINRSQIRERLASSPLMDHAGFAEGFWRAFRTRF